MKVTITIIPCSDCGRWYHHQRGLDRHVRSSRANQSPAVTSVGSCLQDLIIYKDTCIPATAAATAVAVATTVPATTVRQRPTGKLLFTLQQTYTECWEVLLSS